MYGKTGYLEDTHSTETSYVWDTSKYTETSMMFHS